MAPYLNVCQGPFERWSDLKPRPWPILRHTRNHDVHRVTLARPWIRIQQRNLLPSKRKETYSKGFTLLIKGIKNSILIKAARFVTFSQAKKRRHFLRQFHAIFKHQISLTMLSQHFLLNSVTFSPILYYEDGFSSRLSRSSTEHTYICQSIQRWFFAYCRHTA